MTIRDTPIFSIAIALLFLLGGCVAQPQLEKAQDTRLDQVVSQLDQSLANQAAANAQLQAQQRQLEKQEHTLVALNDSLGKALEAPKGEDCPKALACPPLAETSSKMIVGGLEKVWFPDLGMALTARIDTGGATASMDAKDVAQFERDGKPWVRFTIVSPETGKPETFERRLVRTMGFSKSGAAEPRRRPVVKMGVVIGQSEQTAEFSLSDRRHADYQVTVGRSILKDVMVVDVSKENVAPFTPADTPPEEAPGTEGPEK